MPRSLVLLVVGPDKPGLVGRLSELVAAHGGSWNESRMAHLADQFAGIVQVDVAEEKVAELTDSLAALHDEGIEVTVRPATAASAATTSRVTLELVGADRPGIVKGITAALAELGVNVEELQTEVRGAPMTGEDLFRALVIIQLPSDVSRERLQSALELLATDLIVDIEFEEG